MASCTVLTGILNDHSNQYNSHPSAYDIHQVYQTTPTGFLSHDATNYTQFVEKSIGSSSTDCVLFPLKTHIPFNELRVSQPIVPQANQDLYFASIENKLDSFPLTEDNDHRYYSTKQPYQYAARVSRLSSPPVGYKPICVQLLARHGSRTLNGHDYDLKILHIWQLAKQRNLLTSLGEQLKDDIEVFIDENNRVGRGELTQLGKSEHLGISTRLFKRLQPLFLSSHTLSVITSGKKRAIDSAEEFLQGLQTSDCPSQIVRKKVDKKLLYFHKSCPKYMKFKQHDPRVQSKLRQIKHLPQTKLLARNVLKRLFQEDFFRFFLPKNSPLIVDENTLQSNEERSINDEVEIAFCLYSLFSVSPAQNQPHLVRMLAKYFNREESNWFAYINDAQEFYLKGPSIEGTSVTFEMAKPLLADFFSSISRCLEEKSSTAELRFAHAETLIPFATLLSIPGLSDRAADSSDIYRYDNNLWRGEKIAPMAANIQWEVYQHEENSSQILIRMLYNEQETRFKPDCQSITPDSFFYDFHEVKRSYANLLTSFESESKLN